MARRVVMVGRIDRGALEVVTVDPIWQGEAVARQLARGLAECGRVAGGRGGGGEAAVFEGEKIEHV